MLALARGGAIQLPAILSIYLLVWLNFTASRGGLFARSIGPLVHWSIGPNVNKVKLLSEHTSGVPLVIFDSDLRKIHAKLVRDSQSAMQLF